MEVNGTRLLNRLEALARIGQLPGGGVQRLAFSSQDLAGRRYVEDCLQAIGIEARIDAIGNLFGVREGTGPGPVVLLGSHTDTVGNAGTLDGSLGVLAALEVLERLQETHTHTERGVGLVSFVNEEGVRFMPDMMGSLYLRGDLSTNDVRDVRGTDGTCIGECLDALEMAGTDELREVPVYAFLELHIEQGPVLEADALPVSAVTGVQGLRWLTVTLEGASNHAGTTPMVTRRDAGLVAARITDAIRGMTDGVPGLRGTVGRMAWQPNLINVIPRRVEMTIDLRHPDQQTLEAAVRQCRDRVTDLAEAEGVSAVCSETASAPAVDFDPAVVTAVENAMRKLALPGHRMISGAGHDAQIMAGCCPSGMIFIRSRGGISHDPDEFSRPEDIVAGANVLLNAALDLAG